MLMQVTAIEKSISAGKKVAEVQITTLTEMLMRQAVKLDTIPAEGDAIAQKNLEVKVASSKLQVKFKYSEGNSNCCS